MLSNINLARSCSLIVCLTIILLLTAGCMMLGGLPPNTKTSESTVDYSNGYLKYNTRYTFEPPFVTNSTAN
jgi:hypothetical protein